ncbi:hypothetical protein D3C71_1694670 [compost metagenome]
MHEQTQHDRQQHCGKQQRRLVGRAGIGHQVTEAELAGHPFRQHRADQRLNRADLKADKDFRHCRRQLDLAEPLDMAETEKF